MNSMLPIPADFNMYLASPICSCIFAIEITIAGSSADWQNALPVEETTMAQTATVVKKNLLGVFTFGLQFQSFGLIFLE